MNRDGISIGFETTEHVHLHAIDWPSRSVDESAPPIVLLHGGGANAHWWDHLAPWLASYGRVLALDFRGHGDSEHPSEKRIGAFNDDLEALIEHLGRADVHLIGHSLGASVAYDHASRHPETRSATLIDLALGSAPGSGRRARLALSLRRTYASREEAIARFRFLPESSEAGEELRRSIAEHSVREEPDGRFGYKFDGGWFGLASRPRPEPSSIRCPILLIRGGESRLLSGEAAETFATALRSGQLVEIEGAGHHVLLDRPEALLAAIERFHSGLDPAGAR